MEKLKSQNTDISISQYSENRESSWGQLIPKEDLERCPQGHELISPQRCIYASVGELGQDRFG